MRLNRKIHKFTILLVSAFLLVVTSPLLPPIFHFAPTLLHAQTIDDRKAQADNLLKKGIEEYDNLKFGGALGKFEEALLIYQEIGDKVGVGEAFHRIGMVYDSTEEYQKALDYYQKAVAIQRDAKPAAAKITLYRIGKVYYSLEDYQEALNYYQQAVAIGKTHSTDKIAVCRDSDWQGIILEGIGRIYQSLEEYQKAFGYYQEVMAIQQELSDCPDESILRSADGDATLFWRIGFVANEIGKYQESLDYFQKALAIYEKFEEKDDQWITLNQIGIVYRKMGGYQEALDSFQRAQDMNLFIGHFGKGGSFNNIGLVYHDTKDYKKALDSYQKAIQISQEIGDKAGEGVSLNNIGVVYDKLEEYRKALDFYQKALAIVREVEDKKAEGIILNNIAAIYSKQSQSDKALDFYQQALAIFQKLDKKVIYFQGVTLNNIGVTYERIGKSQEAQDYYQQALAIVPEIGQNQTTVKPPVPITLNLEPLILPESPTATKEARKNRLYQQGIQLAKEGEYREAIATFQQSLVTAREVNDKYQEEEIFNQIGRAYNALGEYRLALDFYQQALKINENLPDEKWSRIYLFRQPSRTGAIHSNIGQVYLNLGEYTKALEFFQKASAITKQRGDKKGEVLTINAIANIQSKLGKYESALDYYQEALEIIKTIDTEKKNLEATTIHNIGKVYLKTGKYQLALDLFQQALTINQQFGSQNSTMVILNNIGQAYSQLGEDKLALASWQQALIIAQEIGSKSGEGNTLKNIGYLLEKQNQPQLAILFFKQSVNATETIRHNIKGLPQEIQESYIETIAQDYRTLANLLLKQDRVIEAQQVLDLLKIQELDDYLHNVRGNENTKAGVEYLQPEQQILQQYNTKLTQIIQLGKELAEIQKTAPPQRSPQQEKRIKEIETAQREIQQEYLNFINSPEITTIIQQLSQKTGGENIKPQTLIKLQNDLKKLGQEAAILYPLILDDRLELVLVTPYSPPIRRPVAVKKDELNLAIAEFRSALTKPNKRISLKPAQTTGKQLYDWLIKPIETALTEANTQTIIYAPDGQLRYIPLAALYDGNQWLAQKYRINNITALSITNLYHKSQKMNILAGAFTQGNYDFQVGEDNFSFRGLPFAGKEVETLAKTIPSTTQLLNANFSKSEILAQMSNYSILHFATHAAFVTGKPEESFILFGNGDRANFRDVETWDLTNTDLVVLSACETGLGGKLGDGREILGFGYLMQQAGAKAAMASLWGVDDGGTQVLMNGFYTALTNNNSTKVEALRQAQISLITGDYSGLGEERGLGVVPRDDSESKMAQEFIHPYYWASFILIGNGL